MDDGRRRQIIEHTGSTTHDQCEHRMCRKKQHTPPTLMPHTAVAIRHREGEIRPERPHHAATNALRREIPFVGDTTANPSIVPQWLHWKRQKSPVDLACAREPLGDSWHRYTCREPGEGLTVSPTA